MIVPGVPGPAVPGEAIPGQFTPGHLQPAGTQGGVSLAFPPGDVGYWTGGLIYNGLDIEFGQVDANGITWLLQKVEGWDGPDVQGGGVIPKTGDHGALPSPQFFAARQLTLTVTATAPTQRLRDVARNLFSQAIPVSNLATFRYDEPVPVQAQVRRSGKITEKYPTLFDVTFTAGLVAPDPRKYGTTLYSVPVNAFSGSTTGVTFPATFPLTLPAQPPSGQATVTNNGNFDSPPQITVTGPITSPRLANLTTGQTVSWTGLTVGAGSSLAVDFNLRQALLNGSYVSADPFSSWWTLDTGQSLLQLTGQADGGAQMIVNWRDAYI